MTQIPSRKPDIQIVTEHNSLVSFWWEEMVQAHDSGGYVNLFNVHISKDGEWLYTNNDNIDIRLSTPFAVCSWFNTNKIIITNSYLDYLIEKDVL